MGILKKTVRGYCDITLEDRNTKFDKPCVSSKCYAWSLKVPFDPVVEIGRLPGKENIDSHAFENDSDHSSSSLYAVLNKNPILAS